MRGGAVGAFVGLALAIGARPSARPALAGVLFCLAAAAHTLTQYPPIKPALGLAWPVVWTFSVAGAGLFWAFATELFGDRSRGRALRFAPALLLLSIGIVATLTGSRFTKGLWLAHGVVGGVLLFHVLAMVWSGWRNDLVESRRQLRGPVLAAAALYGVTVIAVETSTLLWRPAQALSPWAAALLLALGLAGIGALLRADPDLFAAAARPEPTTQPPDPTPILTVDESRTLAKLDHLMRVDRAYREETLSIAGLALRVGVPEYRLRRLINQRLGHRNFSAYVGQWRLADALQALADPSQRDVPISTVALDAGFKSLGPFNRAFKLETGLTPTDFRARELASPGAAKP
jgi:AraC-like DNA-binding protein